MINNIRIIKAKISFFMVLIVISSLGCQQSNQEDRGKGQFNGERAYQDVVYQVNLGPRIPGEIGHLETMEWIKEELTENGWQVEIQESQYLDHDIKNIIAFRGQGDNYILIGAHYDTRIYADQDQDPGQREIPVPGANDGASGVAVLLELGRVLPDDLNIPVRLVFFDAEDNGGIGNWDWILGSRAFVQEYKFLPDLAIIVDMIGDAELNIYYEHNSDEMIMDEIWQQARDLGFGSQFLAEFKHSMLDDHTPFIEAGIPAVDIIDFDYPYWHTVDDTLDKVSAESLQAVGDVVMTWLLTKLSTDSVP